MILPRDKWLWVADNLVCRTPFWSGLVLAFGVATSACELGLRVTGFLDTHGFPFGVAIMVAGASGMLMAFLSWIVLGIDTLLNGDD